MESYVASLVLLFLAAVSLWIRHLRKRIRRLDRFRRDLVLNISHEFRTPLSVIKGYTETLSSKSVDAATARSFLEMIRDHTERLIQMVDNLLELSRLENVNPRSSPTLIRLPDFFQSLHRRFHLRLETKKIRWTIDLTPPLENLESDPGLLEMIFNNLVDNAIKYSDPDGEIRITGKRNDGEIEFCVQDRGIGISREEQDRVFERFYRVDRDRGRETGGTGLGLSIVKHAVNALGGKIWVESEAGKGSQFLLTVKERP